MADDAQPASPSGGRILIADYLAWHDLSTLGAVAAVMAWHGAVLARRDRKIANVGENVLV